jgi:sulfite reductase alpha subunit-like flavoprotein
LFSRKTDLIVLSKNSNEILYEPGDHLAIIPGNRIELVDKIIKATNDILNQDYYLVIEELVEKKRNGSKKETIF